jgi:hypothetical protein
MSRFPLKPSHHNTTSFTSFDELHTGYWRRFERRTQELCAVRRRFNGRIQNGGGLELRPWMHLDTPNHIWLSSRIFPAPFRAVHGPGM